MAKKPDEPSLADLGLDGPSKIVNKPASKGVEADPTNEAPQRAASPPVSPPKRPVAQNENGRPTPTATILGWIFVSLGLGLIFYFGFVYDTTLQAEPQWDSSGRRIEGDFYHNAGLQDNRLLGFLSGLSLVMVGSISIALGAILNALRETRPR